MCPECKSAGRHFPPGEGPSRDLLRDYKHSCEPSFEALVCGVWWIHDNEVIRSVRWLWSHCIWLLSSPLPGRSCMQLSMQKPSKQYNLCHRGERQSMPPLISSEYLWMELLSIALTIRYPFGHTTEICSLLHQFSIESLRYTTSLIMIMASSLLKSK